MLAALLLFALFPMVGASETECGNSIVEQGELCDSNEIECDADFGYLGEKICNSDCSSFSVCKAVEFCSDSEVNGAEECDDGNLRDGDGCSTECRIEDMSCVEAKEAGLLKASIRGNKATFTNNAFLDYDVGFASYKMFDNFIDNQELFSGLEAEVPANGGVEIEVDLPNCQYQIDAFCGAILEDLNGNRYGNRLLAARIAGGPDFCTLDPECGDNEVNGDEVCDGNVEECIIDSYKGFKECNSSCSAFEQCVSEAECGDGIVNGPEECDLGLENGDECTNECTLAAGEECGNGLIEEDEQCDDSNYESGDGCFECQIEDGWDCLGEPSECSEICGDGLIVGDEVCDGDENLCLIDEYWGIEQCNDECTAFEQCEAIESCGDGIVNGGEECDDGNNVNGDLCSLTCEIEEEVTCYQDSDCGVDGYVGEEVCLADDVSRVYETHTCENPGTSESECSVSGEEIVIEECAFSCSDGSCTQDPGIPLFVTIKNPIAGNHTSQTLLVNVSSNGDLIRYNINGGDNVEYAGPAFVNFPLGESVIVAVGFRGSESVSDSVTIFIGEQKNETDNRTGGGGGGGGGLTILGSLKTSGETRFSDHDYAKDLRTSTGGQVNETLFLQTQKGPISTIILDEPDTSDYQAEKRQSLIEELGQKGLLVLSLLGFMVLLAVLLLIILLFRR